MHREADSYTQGQSTHVSRCAGSQENIPEGQMVGAAKKEGGGWMIILCGGGRGEGSTIRAM